MKRTANLAAAAFITASLITNAFRFWLLEVVNVHGDDFRFYYSMARVGLTYGWSHIYDLSLQCAPIGPISESEAHCPGLALPPLAWIVTPFTILPYTSAYPLWIVSLALCIAAIVGLLWRRFPEPRGIYAAAALTLYPLVYGLFLGQATIIALLGVVLAWWLLRERRPNLAGVALVLIVAKPQIVLLVPVALALAGRWRTVLVFASLSSALGLVALATLGPHGVTAYDSIARDELGQELNYVYTFAGLFGHTTGTALQYVLGLVALVTAWRFRDHLDAVFLLGILGSALVSPYWHVPDYVVLIPAAAFQLSLGPRSPALLLAAALFVVGSPFAVGVTFMPSVVQVGSWLVLETGWLLWLASRPADAFVPVDSLPAVAAA
ncbi:MAG: glycosyltransferase family 87 protein [Candidatus Dormiibacterota bacterium]